MGGLKSSQVTQPAHAPSFGTMVMFDMEDGQFQLVYNVLSFSLASMMATTLFLWLKVPTVNGKYQSAVIISGLVTFIAAYHYFRIFNSWVEAYTYENLPHGATDPVKTGVPFNDAYRYMDWLLTVPLLLMEIVLVMNLPADKANSKCMSLGVASFLMIAVGYPGELIMEGNLSQRWKYWGVAMVFFSYIVYELLVGLSGATNAEPDETVRGLIKNAQVWTVISWLTYPVVYILPMLGFAGAQAVVGIQCGYCVSDIISKCGVGLIIYRVTAAKSALETKGALLAK